MIDRQYIKKTLNFIWSVHPVETPCMGVSFMYIDNIKKTDIHISIVRWDICRDALYGRLEHGMLLNWRPREKPDKRKI